MKADEPQYPRGSEVKVLMSSGAPVALLRLNFPHGEHFLLLFAKAFLVVFEHLAFQK